LVDKARGGSLAREGVKMKIRQAGAVGGPSRTSIAAYVTSVLAIVLSIAAPGPAGAHTSSPPGPAKKALLVLSDLPGGWTSKPSSSDSSSFPGARQLAGCLGVPTSIITANAPTANSPEFVSNDQLRTVTDSVSIYPSARSARADFASLANTKTPSCLTQVLNGPARGALASGFGAGSTLGTILVSRSPAADFAPGAANFTAFMPITTHGVTLNFELTVVDYVKGKNEQTVIFTAVQSQFPTSLARHLTAVAVGRL